MCEELLEAEASKVGNQAGHDEHVPARRLGGHDHRLRDPVPDAVWNEAARHYDELKLRESEEIKGDRAYLDRITEDLVTSGFTVRARLANTIAVSPQKVT